MPLFITQGRFTRDEVRGMLAKPEDRAVEVERLFAQFGGKLLAYYMTFGDYDFLIVSEGPYEGVAASTILSTASGAVSELKTTLAISSADMKVAFERVAAGTVSFRPSGT